VRSDARPANLADLREVLLQEVLEDIHGSLGQCDSPQCGGPAATGQTEYGRMHSRGETRCRTGPTGRCGRRVAIHASILALDFAQIVQAVRKSRKQTIFTAETPGGRLAPWGRRRRHLAECATRGQWTASFCRLSLGTKALDASRARAAANRVGSVTDNIPPFPHTAFSPQLS